MIKKVTTESEINVNDFSLPWSIYPLANFKKYGLSADIFSVFTSDGQLFTKHDDTIQICSNDLSKESCGDIAKFVQQNRIRMIAGKRDNLEKLLPLVPNSILKHGYIFELDNFEIDSTFSIEDATTETQFKDIAKLVCKANNDNKSYYGLEQYFSQIYERYKDGYCHNWIMRQKNDIIGHIATYAETESYAVLGGLAVDETYRGKGIAKALLLHSISCMKKEGKVCYAFCYNEKLISFYRKHGFREFEYAKILIDNQN